MGLNVVALFLDPVFIPSCWLEQWLKALCFNIVCTSVIVS